MLELFFSSPLSAAGSKNKWLKEENLEKRRKESESSSFSSVSAVCCCNQSTFLSDKDKSFPEIFSPLLAVLLSYLLILCDNIDPAGDGEETSIIQG